MEERERERYVILTKGGAFWVNVCVGSFFLNCTRTKDMMPRGVGWDVARVHMWEQGEKKEVTRIGAGGRHVLSWV